MKTQLLVSVALALAACGNPTVQAKLDPKAATLQAVRSCMTAVPDRQSMMVAVQSNAQSPTYAAEAKAAAEKCAESGRQLRAIQADHPCLPMVRFYEGMNWTMASELEGKPAIETFSMTAGGMGAEIDANADACALAAGSPNLSDINVTQ